MENICTQQSHSIPLKSGGQNAKGDRVKEKMG